MPSRTVRAEPLNAPIDPLFEEFAQGTEGRKASTTMVFVRILSKLLRDKEIGDLIVPIVPDEARTFGMESLFRQVGIYSHIGQKYEPVDMDTLLYYKEAQDGQILEEGHHRSRARCRRSSPPAPPTPPTASTRSPSSSTTRCSASSASAI